MTARVRAAAAAAWGVRAEALHVACILGGWTLVTAGLSRMLPPVEVWLLSGGLFLLSVAGWGHLRTLFAVGVYALTRGGKRRA